MKSVPEARWWHILLPSILIYIFSFMDRTHIGFAMAGGMNETLKVHGCSDIPRASVPTKRGTR